MSIEIINSRFDDFNEVKVQELFELRQWMVGKTFLFLTKVVEVEQFIDKCIENGLCSLDFETTGLNTRLNIEGKPCIDIVGICLSVHADEGAYIPVGHEDKEYNVPLKFVMRQLARLVANCRCIFHNFKYDGEILRNYGIIIEDEDKYEDTYLMAAVQDASRKDKGLKELSKLLLDRDMIEISELSAGGSSKKVVAFDMVPPQIAQYYGGSDGMCTYALYEKLSAMMDEQDPTKKKGSWTIYKIEKRCLFVTMEMERNLVKVDVEYLRKCRDEVKTKIEKYAKGIQDQAGRPFDINSPKQLGTLLFEEMKIPYPAKEEKTASGQYATSEKVLEKLGGKYPIVDMILSYRGLGKILETYIENFLRNVDENHEIKFNLKQVQADTGRFSAAGGQGVAIDGYSGVNCQNIPNYDPKNPNSIDLRKAVIARPGYKIVSIDYSGEELRIAANFSREPLWVKEFCEGTGDLHSITARIIHKKQDVDKKERGVGKTLNFLTLYGGGAGGFATKAKVPYDTAKKMIINFFEEYKGLKKWIDKEAAAARKRGYSQTALGRRRPLTLYYNSPEKSDQAFADRCAINSAIQGCLPPHERVLTTEGYLSIKETSDKLANNEQLKVWTGTSWADFIVVDRGEAQFAKIELSNGIMLDCDTRHEVLVVGSEGYVFKKYADLTESDNVCVSPPSLKEFGSYPKKVKFSGGTANNSIDISVTSHKKWNFLAYFVGYAVGDGTVRFNNRESVTVSFGKDKLLRNEKFLRDGLRALGLSPQKVRKSKGSKGESYSFEIGSKALVSIFEYLGYSFKGSRNKRIPAKIFSSPIAMRLEFLRGLFDTDCCKKAINRYSLHTPNRMLLRDVQLLGWTLGAASRLCWTGAGTFRLDWSDLAAFEKLLNLPLVSCLKKRTCNRMLLPDFLHEQIYRLLKAQGPLKNSNDRALLCNLKRKRSITVSTVLRLLQDYEIVPPKIYYHFPLKRKETLEERGNTYTLSVNDPGHRFDSAGIISKNTGADILKIALYRVWKWIRNSGLQDDIKILAPVHDEVVFEVKEDKLEALIPEMCTIMCLHDVTKALGWPVPLDVDAEYGDNFHVDHNFWEEHKKEKELLLKQAEEALHPKVEESQAIPAAPVVAASPVTEEPQVPVEEPASIEAKSPITQSSDVQDSITAKDARQEEVESTITVQPYIDTPEQGSPTATNSVSTGSTQYYVNITVKNALTEGSEKKEDFKKILTGHEEFKGSSVFQDARIKDRIDPRGYFNYPLDIDSVSARKLRFILDTLAATGNSVFVGPKYKICAISKDGEVYYRSTEAVHIDAFLALCLAFNI
jgi:DNA polymerase I-like protein with 3'-5' exonuclease and polymerase domains